MMPILPTGVRGVAARLSIVRSRGGAYWHMASVGALLMTLSCSGIDVSDATPDATPDAPEIAMGHSDASVDHSVTSSDAAAIPMGHGDATVDHSVTTADSAYPRSDSSSADAGRAPDAIASRDARYAADADAPISIAEAGDASLHPSSDAEGSTSEVDGAADARSAADVLTGPACDAADEVRVEGTVGAQTFLTPDMQPACFVYTLRTVLHVDRVLCGSIAAEVIVAPRNRLPDFQILREGGHYVLTLAPLPDCGRADADVAKDIYVIREGMLIDESDAGDAAVSE